jgi:hypothetical protein
MNDATKESPRRPPEGRPAGALAMTGKVWPRALGVFLAALALYHLNGSPQPEVDCIPAPYAAWSLVGKLASLGQKQKEAGPDGGPAEPQN